MLTRVFPAVPAGARAFFVDAFFAANRKSTSPKNAMVAAVALALLAAPITPAQAGWIRTTQCAGRWWGNVACTTQWGMATDPYVRTVPAARSEQEDAELAERDRKWVARCRPVIRPDQNGVERYHYAAPGCEFGRISD